MFLRTTSSALAVLALSTPVFADVTPAEVWQNWIDYYKASGYAVTEGAREEAGETLTLKDVTIAFDDPTSEAGLSFTTPEITLTATGDGGVRTVMSETSTAFMTFQNEEGEDIRLDGTLSMPGNESVSSGSAADMTNDSKAAEIVMALDKVTTAEGEKAFPLSVRLTNVTSHQRHVDGDVIAIDATVDADRLELAGSFDDTEGERPGRVGLEGGMDALKFAGKFAMPKGVDLSRDMNAALKAGLSMDGTMSAGAGQFSFDFAGKDEEGKDQTANGSTDMKGFDLAFAMSAAGLKYSGSADSSSAEVTMSDLPFPISYGIENSTFDLQMPVMQSDEPAPFKFAYSLGGLTLADGIWNLFDPQSQLPRDPASLDVDVTGMTRVAMDLFDPANMQAIEAQADQAGSAADTVPADAPAADAPATDAPAADAPATDAPATDPAAPAAPAADSDATAPVTGETAADASPSQPNPFEPTEITINKIALDAVGAKVDASGQLSVPEGGSVDAPVGKIEARMDGVNGLIDRLAQMGFIPEDQVAGVRMMLAMFARPAPEGGDALVSEFEFREGGQIFANGQQVK